MARLNENNISLPWDKVLENYIFYKIKNTDEFNDCYLKRCQENKLRSKIKNGIRYTKTFEFEMLHPEYFYKEVINGIISWDDVNTRIMNKKV